MRDYNFPIVIEKDENGYFVSCPFFQGCAVQGATHEEAMTNIGDAIKLHIEDRLEQNEVISEREYVSVSMLHVAME